ncbi:MAG: membrane protein insertase YidC [Blastocatellia bacterium]
MQNQDNQSQFRFLAAALLSMVVLFGWSYFYAPTKPVDNTNTTANANTAQPESVPTQAPQPLQSAPATAVTTPDTTPNRSITIKSPLYEVTLDSKGAVATSWVLLKNKSPKADYQIYADGSTDSNKKPLQLISQKALEQTPRDVPFRLATDDQNLTNLVNERNYQISVPDETITLADNQEKQINFTLVGDNGLEVKKSFIFRANSYLADLAVDLRQNGQMVPNTRLLIGASIGDHAINHHTFYQIESEAVAAIDGDIYRHQGNYSFTYDASNKASLAVPGNVDWAGVSDSYFAMTAIPAERKQGYELKSLRYEVDTQPFYSSIFSWIIRSPTTKETRHLVTAYVPINADGSTTKIFTGTKDYFLLNSLSGDLDKMVGRELDFVKLINISN